MMNEKKEFENMINIFKPEPHRVIKIVRQTIVESTFRVLYDGPVKFGQFFMISIPKVGEAPISVSGYGDGYIEFTIRKVGKLTNGVFEINEGGTLFIRGPYGNPWPVDTFENKDLVVICGGTGMAAVKTLIFHFYDHPEICKSVNIIAGFKNKASSLFDDERELLKQKFNCIYTLDSGAEAGFEGGMVTEHISKIPFDIYHDYNVVIVGPPMMMKASAEKCMESGVPKSKIWVSFERKMECALGKCGHCKINEHYVCLEGPVFNYDDASQMFD